MLWTIDLACAAILMSLTGSICLLLWALPGRILERAGFYGYYVRYPLDDGFILRGSDHMANSENSL
jgi:hypothetical protein